MPQKKRSACEGWIGKCVLFILDRQFFPQFQRCDFGRVALGLNV